MPSNEAVVDFVNEFVGRSREAKRNALHWLPPKPFKDPGASLGHYIAGFIDGEGSFGISPNGHIHSIVPVFRLSLREDDYEILHLIQETLGIGGVCHDTCTKSGKPSARYSITGTDCLNIVRLLDKYPLRAKKQNDFKVWREAVDVYCMFPATPGRHQALYNFKDELNTARAYVPVGKETVTSKASSRRVANAE